MSSCRVYGRSPECIIHEGNRRSGHAEHRIDENTNASKLNEIRRVAKPQKHVLIGYAGTLGDWPHKSVSEARINHNGHAWSSIVRLRFSYGFGGAADLIRPRGSETALQRRTCGCALPRSPAADTRSNRCG